MGVKGEKESSAGQRRVECELWKVLQCLCCLQLGVMWWGGLGGQDFGAALTLKCPWGLGRLAGATGESECLLAGFKRCCPWPRLPPPSLLLSTCL